MMGIKAKQRDYKSKHYRNARKCSNKAANYFAALVLKSL